MKISISSKYVNKAWGGGNQFIKNLTNYFNQRGHKVIFDLNDINIDLILLTDPRPYSSSVSFNHFDIKKYLLKKPNTIVVHRINECDEKRNTNHVNYFIKQASKITDHRVFISKWLQSIHSINKKKESIILNGANKKIFKDYKNKINNKKINLVTHHWSSNKKKGEEFYVFIDSLLKDDYYKNNFTFSYIGNLSKNCNLKYSKVYKPHFGVNLAKLISKHNVYITASENEPGGNHQNEGLNCGLPALYLKSGCMDEYCKTYGYSFKNKKELINALIKIRKNYKLLFKKTKMYKFNSNLTCSKYLRLFEELLRNKNSLIKKRFKKLSIIDYVIYLSYKKFYKFRLIFKRFY